MSKEYDYKNAISEARARAATPEEHLWCIALAVGPDGGEMWQAADGTPVDIARHLTAVAEALKSLRDDERELLEADADIARVERRRRERVGPRGTTSTEGEPSP